MPKWRSTYDHSLSPYHNFDRNDLYCFFSHEITFQLPHHLVLSLCTLEDRSFTFLSIESLIFVRSIRRHIHHFTSRSKIAINPDQLVYIQYPDYS